MKSLEILFTEALGGMDAKQKARFFTERDNLKKDGKLPVLEVQLNLARSITGGKVTESFRESAPKRNNGAVQESTSVATDIQERQAKAWKAMGFSEVDAEIMAGVHDGKLRQALAEGKNARQFFESLRESAAPEKNNLRERQSRAMSILNRK